MSGRPEAVELRRVAVPLVEPFRTAHGVEVARDVVLVRVLTAGGGEGWGECVAPAEPTYTSEWAGGAWAVLREHLVPRLLAGEALGAVAGHPMAKAALEGALLDGELRATGRSLADWLGGTRPAVDAGVALGITGSVLDLLAAVERVLADGYRRVKLKVEPGWDVEPVSAVRGAFGDELALQVDGNRSYAGTDAAERLARLDDFGLVLIEQPLAADDLLGHAALARRLATPICLDETITSVAATATALALGACSVVNLKPGRVGGLAEARRIHDLCVERGVALWCGGMLETGIGKAANVALASLPGFTLPGDLPASRRWFRQDLTPPFELVDGRLTVPTGPGLGVDVLPEVLAELTVEVELLRP